MAPGDRILKIKSTRRGISINVFETIAGAERKRVRENIYRYSIKIKDIKKKRILNNVKRNYSKDFGGGGK